MSNKVRIGIIGVGGRGNGFLNLVAREYADSTTAAGVADTNRVRLEAGLKRNEVDCPAYTDYRDLLKRKDIDAVIVTSPDYLHEEHACAVLKAKKHVFVDKPLATTVEGCLNIVRAARRSGKLLYMGFNLRFDPVIRRLRRVIDDDAAGRIFRVECQEFYDGGRSYFSRWNRLRKFSGGLWVHKGSHDFDVMNWLMGARPKRVAAFGRVSTLTPDHLPPELDARRAYGPRCGVCRQGHRCPDFVPAPADTFGKDAIAEDGYARDLCIYKSDKDTHDQGVSIVEYENGGTGVHSECFVTSVSNRLYTVIGDRGTVTADVRGNRVTVRPRWTQDTTTIEVQRGTGGHGGADPVMMQNFIECLQGRGAPLSDVLDGVWSVAVAQSAEAAMTEHRMMEIRELLNPKSRLLTPKTG